MTYASEDSLVPVAGSEAFKKLVEAKVEGTSIGLDTAPGEHGFDGTIRLDKTGFPVKDRMVWLEEAWQKGVCLEAG